MIELALIPGDGVGPEVMGEVISVLAWAQAQGRALRWAIFPYGAEHFLETGESLSDEHFAQLRDEFDAILFGAVGDPRIPDGRHADALLLRLRRELQLNVNFRPCHPWLDRLFPLKGIPARDVNIEVFRENTEGPYCMQGESSETRGVDFAVHTWPAIERLLTAAFQRAETIHGAVALAHKANVMKHGHGLWMRVFKDIAGRFPAVPARAVHADALLCELVQDPRRFQVIAADNFVGDLVSDLLAAFQGGMGTAPSASWSPHRPYRCTALFEPVHGSAPDIAGKNMANPIGMFLSTALLFRHLGWECEAALLENAVRQTLEAGVATRDIAPGNDGVATCAICTCSEMGVAIRSRLL
jgi:3-isopropylmalate dehydrogenase